MILITESLKFKSKLKGGKFQNMNEEAFMTLVNENNGFEFVIGYKDFVDHRIGGTGNKYWYFIDYNGKKQEYFLGTYENGTWTDKFYTKKGTEVEKHGFMCNHYMFGFGEKAVETVPEYGITEDFNDINDNDNAYHLRDILTGKDVEKPEE